MSIPTTTASPWPCRAAYFYAAIFTGASGSINVTYGWQKGSDFAGSLTWAAVAAAVAIVFALSWPALIRSLEARRWSASLVALVALVLAGSYSVTAALGSAAGGRANAVTAETATTDARKRTQDAYDSAHSELAALKPSRPVSEMEALLKTAKPVCRIVVAHGYRDDVCSPPPALVAELGRAKRRVELEGKIERATTEPAKTAPAKQANSDARTLARYLQALGVNATPEHLNDLLVLLSVLMIDVGGGLSLAVGMALSGPAVAPTGPAPSNLAKSEHHQPPALNASVNAVGGASGTQAYQVSDASKTPALRPAPGATVPALTIMDLLREAGGAMHTTTRRLGAQVGRPAATVHSELRRLAASGLITVDAGSRGTHIALVSAGKPN